MYLSTNRVLIARSSVHFSSEAKDSGSAYDCERRSERESPGESSPLFEPAVYVPLPLNQLSVYPPPSLNHLGLNQLCMYPLFEPAGCVSSTL